jgi:hypothetical protein
VSYLKVEGNKLTGEGLDGVRSLPGLTVLNAAHNEVSTALLSVSLEVVLLQLPLYTHIAPMCCYFTPPDQTHTTGCVQPLRRAASAGAEQQQH